MSDVSLTEIEGAGTAVLREPSTGSEVHVVADVGANVARFRTRVGDRPVEVLAAPPDMATLRERPTRWGSACLFPYPGRIKEGRFRFRGREIQLPVDPRDGNAIHGAVRTRPWRIAGMAAGEDGASVTARISTAEARIPTAEWPWPFELALTISLRGGVLRVATEAQNVGAEPMPFGLGFHPYFPIPLGSGDAGRCEVWIEASERWGHEGGLPTGEVTPIGPEEWPRRATPLAQVPPDSQMAEGPVRNVLVRRDVSGPSDAPGGVRAGLRDPQNGVAVTLTASAGFGRIVLFTPASPPVISLEPQTCVPNAHRLAGETDRPTGLVVLDPGGRWRGWWDVRAEAI
ncbi:MAG TPA: aldose 1-epimerase [Chloroflexota bacterium]|jgi:aldose 1-epimerase|nr:aldose 1-epimerase [Chloroflexota bacterium]